MSDIQKNMLINWMDKGKHLPDCLRDFHDQKRVFKLVGSHKVRSFDEITWSDGMIYVIDRFLWIMAKFGYTLQKSKSKQPFYDLQKTLDERERQEAELLNQLIAQHKQSNDS